MASYHFAECVHRHKMKINVSLYRKWLVLKLMWHIFISLCISMYYQGLPSVYICAVYNKKQGVIIDIWRQGRSVRWPRST